MIGLGGVPFLYQLGRGAHRQQNINEIHQHQGQGDGDGDTNLHGLVRHKDGHGGQTECQQEPGEVTLKTGAFRFKFTLPAAAARGEYRHEKQR